MSALPKPRVSLAPVTALSSDQNGQRLLLHNITWDTYKAIADALGEKNLRLTFDRGALEFMTISAAHERFKILFGILIGVLAEELDRLVGGFGSFTHQREDLARALEPDLCYYLGNFSKVRGKKDIDLTRDPPPDLAIEIEISRSLLDRLGILAALKVPEVWRFNGKAVKILVWKSGKYKESRRSPSFPEMPVHEIVRFLEIGNQEGDLAMIRAFRTWVRTVRRN